MDDPLGDGGEAAAGDEKDGRGRPESGNRHGGSMSTDLMILDEAEVPSLCDQAVRHLAEVSDIAACLKMRDIVEAMRTYAAKHRFAQAARDETTKLVVLVEQRIGHELIAAQQRGELALQGRPKNLPD